MRLDIEEVQESLESLEGKHQVYGGSKKLKRIEFIKPKFKIYLPCTEGAEEIKKALCESGLAVTGNLNIFYAILFLSIAHFLIFYYPSFQNFLGLKTTEQFFLFAAFLGFISIPIGGYFAHRWYQLTIFTQKIKGFNYYLWVFVFLAALIVLSIYNQWDKFWTIIGGIAALITVLIAVFQMAIPRK